jgi:hypothetical protein
LDDAWPAHGDARGHDGPAASLDLGRPLGHEGASHSDPAVRASHSGDGVGSDGGCGLPDVPTPAELGGLLDGLVSDFRQGASVLAWQLAEPAKGGTAGADGCWHFPSAEAGPGAGLAIGAGLGEALAPSLNLHELLGGGGHALLDGVDLEAALQRALASNGSSHGADHAASLPGLPEVHPFTAGEAADADCAPAPSPAAAAEPAHAATGPGCGGEVQHALVSLELGWSAGGPATSPLAPLLDPHRQGGEGC